MEALEMVEKRFTGMLPSLEINISKDSDKERMDKLGFSGAFKAKGRPNKSMYIEGSVIPTLIMPEPNNPEWK